MSTPKAAAETVKDKKRVEKEFGNQERHVSETPTELLKKKNVLQPM